MGVEGAQCIRIPWTRAEIVAVREAIEVTPLFEGRSALREIVRVAIKTPRANGVNIPADTAQRLAERIVPTDTVTALARAKLTRAVRATGLSPGSGTRTARRR